MKKNELKEILEIEKTKYAQKSYEELRKLEYPIVYETGEGASWYETEIDILENNNEYLHVQVCVHDNHFFRSISPLNTSFLIYKDGRVDA